MDAKTYLYDSNLSTDELISKARERVLAVRQPALETFVPLYLTNYCDGFCRICNMRATNHQLTRIQGDKENVKKQLSILRNIDRVSAVCLLTGEYRFGEQRSENLELVCWSIGESLEQGFQKIYINIGSLTTEEIQLLYDAFSDNSNKIVLSLFQETYHREAYSKFFGGFEEQNPKANFDMRLSTPMRWISEGSSQVDIGILLGLRLPHFDVNRLVEHANLLHQHGAEVAISLPRLKGLKRHPYPIDDNLFKRIVAFVAMTCPWARVIITTREDIAMIKELLPIIGVVSPGTSDVLPYTKSGSIPNRIQTSQFQVAPMRPRPSWTLTSLEVSTIKYFESNSSIEESSIV